MNPQFRCAVKRGGLMENALALRHIVTGGASHGHHGPAASRKPLSALCCY
jgi:hypothetical protein